MGTLPYIPLAMAIPVRSAYFPGPRMPAIAPSPAFHFLGTGREEGHHELSDSISIQPTTFQLPWPSSFPAARQCRHWKEAQASCIELIINIRRLQAEKSKAVPDGFMLTTRVDDSPALTPKEQLIVDSAVNAAAYMTPNASPARSRLISQLYMLLWVQDGKDTLLCRCLYLVI